LSWPRLEYVDLVLVVSKPIIPPKIRKERIKEVSLF